MSYGHAHELLADGETKSPADELRVAVRRLGAWAKANPPLRELHGDFEACLATVDAFAARAAGSEPLPGKPLPWHLLKDLAWLRDHGGLDAAVHAIHDMRVQAGQEERS
jgi:hypothetical protein